MKKLWKILVLAIVALVGSGCSRDADVEAFITKLDGFTNEVVQRVNNSKDPKQGVADAQKYLNEHQSEIKSAYNDISSVRGFQVKEETMSKLEKSIVDNTTKVSSLKLKYISQTMEDKEFDQQLDKLSDSYQEVVTGGDG